MDISRYKRWLHIGAVLFVAASFLYLAFGRLDWEKVASALPSISILPLLLTLPVLAVQYYLRIVRWWWMLREIQPNVAIRACAGPLLASYTINNTVPLRAGDIFRAVGFRQQLRTPGMQIFGTLIIERVLDLFVLLVFFTVIASVTRPPRMPNEWIVGALWITSILLISIALLIVLLRPIGDWLQRVADASESRSSRVRLAIDKGQHLLDSLALLRSPKLMLELLAQSVVIWSLDGTLFFLVAISLHLALPVAAPWFVMATGTLGTLIPGSPGHLGTFDYFTLESLAAYGTQRELAGIFTILVHIIIWLPVTLAGGLYLLFSGRLHKGAMPYTT